MKRVIVFRNGSSVDGKVLLLNHSLEELLATASHKFIIKAKRFFTPQGGEIDDPKLIRDDDILYVTEEEPFKYPEDAHHYTCTHCPIKSTKDDSKSSSDNTDWVSLNVGGTLFSTTRSTLTTKEPNSMLARMFASSDEADGASSSPLWPSTVDNNGAYLIDRSPTYFEPLLNYLRHGQIILDNNINPQGVVEEARFFGIDSIIPILESMYQEEEGPTDQTPLTRRNVVDALISTPHTSELRFQGINLAGADLCRLDLRHINFKYANLKGAKLAGANMSYCCLERADLSGANLEGALLLGVKMVCANLEGAVLKSCNMEDPTGIKANMEGVNLKSANLEGSQMAGVNLRVATLKNANLQNCDLRGAVLAGADLENCDLSGSDLHEANLRGANLKDTAFELMLTPLHMAQAIR